MLTEQRTSGIEQQLRQACADLDAALRDGLPARAEQFFATNPILVASVESAVEIIYVEFATRQELGQRPSPEEFYLRFPWWKSAIQRQLAIHDWLSQATEQTAAPAPEEPVPELPWWLGEYELRGLIAQGGAGRVYRAWQHGLERAVAVKVLRQEANRSVQAREQFCQEARILARLRHPNIMPVHDVGECDGVVYFSMDYMPGGSLADRLAAGPPPDPSTVVGWLEKVARAVHHAHQRGIVHRDIKPSNILFDEEGQPVLSDFGLAAVPSRVDDPLVLRLFAGSPAYMAPEQFSASGGGHQPTIDTWAIGVVLYESLAGQRPFQADRLASLERLICTTDPPPLRTYAPHLPNGLEAICARCLARDPAHRFASAALLAGELGEATRESLV